MLKKPERLLTGIKNHNKSYITLDVIEPKHLEEYDLETKEKEKKAEKILAPELENFDLTQRWNIDYDYLNETEDSVTEVLKYDDSKYDL